MRIVDAGLRIAFTAAHHILKAGWFVRRPKTYGAHGIALTTQRKIVLVKLRYAPGWRVPGGGRSPNEPPVEAALRELREEIGLIAHGETRLVADLEESRDFKRDTSSLVIVRDASYSPPRWSWEIERVREFALDALPADLSPVTETWIEAIRKHL